MSPLSDEDERFLLAIARRSVEAAVQGRGLPDPQEFSPALAQKAGAFATLRRRRALRGCIGQVEPRHPLVRAVPECAASAALHDPRFPPLVQAELSEITIEISVLSPPFETRAEDIIVGRHGLVVSSGFQRGLLLPQVAVEWNWDREKFLDETCLKAGLQADAWRRGARIRAFTTQVFAETQGSTAIPALLAGRSPGRMK